MVLEALLRQKRTGAAFEPSADLHASTHYRKDVAGVLVRRAVALAHDKANAAAATLPDRRDSMIYELREYIAVPGRGQRLHDRFSDHTLELFERYQLEVVGFWVDQTDPERVIYLMRFPDQATREQRWAAFQEDPDWKRVKAESEADGPIATQMIIRELSNPAYWTRETTAASTP